MDIGEIGLQSGEQRIVEGDCISSVDGDDRGCADLLGKCGEERQGRIGIGGNASE